MQFAIEGQPVALVVNSASIVAGKREVRSWKYSALESESKKLEDLVTQEVSRSTS